MPTSLSDDIANAFHLSTALLMAAFVVLIYAAFHKFVSDSRKADLYFMRSIASLGVLMFVLALGIQFGVYHATDLYRLCPVLMSS